MATEIESHTITGRGGLIIPLPEFAKDEVLDDKHVYDFLHELWDQNADLPQYPGGTYRRHLSLPTIGGAPTTILHATKTRVNQREKTTRQRNAENFAMDSEGYGYGGAQDIVEGTTRYSIQTAPSEKLGKLVTFVSARVDNHSKYDWWGRLSPDIEWQGNRTGIWEFKSDQGGMDRQKYSNFILGVLDKTVELLS